MNISLIERNIDELERYKVTAENVEQLAALYVVHDHLSNGRNVVDVMPDCGEGEFRQACCDKDISKVFEILNEHMQVVQALLPREYAAVIDRIKNIS